jgi:hypothetical protein
MALWMALYVNKDRELARAEPPELKATEYQFPKPELQGNPGADMKKFLAEEGQVLDGYGWRDEKAHVARLPITRGIDAVVAKGLPVHKDIGSAPTTTPAPVSSPAPSEEAPK